MPLSRRALIRAGAAGLVATALPSSGNAANHGEHLAGPSGHVAGRGPRPADWRALAASLDGTVELPGTTAYETARRLVDPRFDGVRPPAVVRCASGADVTEVVRFARRLRLPVVPRGGGHSYVGASTSRTGVVLDLRRLDTVAYDAATRSATIGGGARLIDVYNRLDTYGVAVPSGSCGSVGIGGITLGGGIGMAASTYGLTCDVVSAAEVVTADGRRRTVDAAREPDLFWALRGAGGGQFGVVTAWRMRTHRATPVGRFVLAYPWSDAARVAAGWQARLTVAPDETWSSCQFAADARGRLSVRISGVVLDGDPDAEVAAIVRAIGREPRSVTLRRLSYLEVVHERAGCDDATSCATRSTELIGSEIFPRVLPGAGVAALLATVERRARARRPGVAKLKRMTGALGRVRPDATAFAWRGAHTMLQWLVESPTSDAATAADAYRWIADGHRAMGRWSAGRYVNYLEPDPALVPLYHGGQLARLRRVRAAVDPQRLFRSPYAI
ncbi:FAD-binding oxidoreductase [Actinoplanes sp. NPDC051346]|uniref:FAD-binding oxidoreductase n=1 Tax=Actinoplanes sp. NPDC051346 TaxID=3155048 RepID=UPI003449AE5E